MFWQAVAVLPSRRQLLLGAAVAVTQACTIRRGPRRPPTASGSTTPTATAAAGPDPVVAAAARERALLAAYDDLLARHPGLAPLLSTYRADHAAHLHALEPGAVVSATVTPAPRRSPRKAEAQARRRLRALEARTAEAHARAAVSAPLAQAGLLASLAACEAAHAELL